MSFVSCICLFRSFGIISRKVIVRPTKKGGANFRTNLTCGRLTSVPGQTTTTSQGSPGGGLRKKVKQEAGKSRERSAQCSFFAICAGAGSRLPRARIKHHRSELQVLENSKLPYYLHSIIARLFSTAMERLRAEASGRSEARLGFAYNAHSG